MAKHRTKRNKRRGGDPKSPRAVPTVVGPGDRATLGDQRVVEIDEVEPELGGERGRGLVQCDDGEVVCRAGGVVGWGGPQNCDARPGCRGNCLGLGQPGAVFGSVPVA